jgi:hypothetical protein
MDGNEIRRRSHGDILLEREESGRESNGNIKKMGKQQEGKQTGVRDEKTWSRQ